MADNKIPLSFWVCTALLTGYVALCAGQRDNVWRTDAWEYHRVILALTNDLWNPGNPTCDTDDSSPRYTPYTVLWALFSRATGVDPFDALSLATVINILLLVVGAAMLLRSYGEGRSATAALVVMLVLYGGETGYSCSSSVSDMPWIGANPSAFSLGLTMWIWVCFRSLENGRRRGLKLLGLVLLSATAMLDHAMIGVLAHLGIWLFALTAQAGARRRLAAYAFALGCSTVALCLAWPWFSFLRAATMNPLPRGTLNRSIHRLTMFFWCFPALLASFIAFQYRERKLVRVLLFGGYLCYALGLCALVLPDRFPGVGVMARLPLPGLIFFHLPIGVFVHRAGLLRVTSWPRRLRSVFAGDRATGSRATLEVLLSVALLYCAAPQLWWIVQRPYLARGYVAPLLGRVDRQLNLKSRLDALLADVGRRDVVLSDPVTSWPVPSSRGRIVYPLNPEWFIADDPQRESDVETFFAPAATDMQRVEILERRDVKWILLNRQELPADVHEALYFAPAVVATDGDLALMDAARWSEGRSRGK